MLELSPNEYRQEVQSHPGMMLITALNKQYHARKISISYNNSSPQIYSFDISSKGINLQKKTLKLLKSSLTKFLKTLKLR